MITIFDYFGYDTPYKERYKFIREVGFDGVLLFWSDEFGNKDYKLLPQYARQSGLYIENIHTSFENLNSLWLDNLDGKRNVEYLVQCIDDCSNYEIPTMIVHLTEGNSPPEASDIGFNRIKFITERAERKGINIALENLRRPDYLEYVYANVKSDRLKFCFDSGHQNCHLHSKDLDLLSMYGDKLISLHLHDNDGMQDQHMLPFEGNIKWETTMKKITSCGYIGATALEVTKNTSYESLTCQEFLNLAYERAKRLDEFRYKCSV